MFKKTLTAPDGRLITLYSTRPIEDDISIVKYDEIESKTSHERWHPLLREWVIFADDNVPVIEFSGDEFELALIENPSVLNMNKQDSPDLIIPTQGSLGSCEIIAMRENTTLARSNHKQIQLYLEVMAERTKELGQKNEIQYIVPYEYQELGQIVAFNFVPPLQERFLESMKKHWIENGTGLMEQIIRDEQDDGRRIVLETEHIISFIPAFARTPYETWITPKRKTAFLHELTNEEMFDLSVVLQSFLLKLDRLWQDSLTYVLTIHQAPVKGDWPFAHLFIQIAPVYLNEMQIGSGVYVNNTLPEENAEDFINVSSEQQDQYENRII